jgi:biotin operon repressor
VLDTLEVVKTLTDKLPKDLPKGAVKLFGALVGVAVETIREKNYSPATTHLTMHLPLEVLARVCGMHRVTVWRHLPALRALGVLDYRAHKGTLRGETRNTGTLFCVRLNPSVGSKAKLSYQDLCFKWRDLDKDVRRKKTAYRQLKNGLQQSVALPMKGVNLEPLKLWTLNQADIAPVTSDSCKAEKGDLHTILDIFAAKKNKKAEKIRFAADAIAIALNDSRSKRFYMRLLWAADRRRAVTGQDYASKVLAVVLRAAVDVTEGFARSGGALAVSRLKASGLYEDILLE